MSNWIAITAGDAAGIGPEVALKAISAELGRDSWQYLLIGDASSLRTLNERLNLAVPLNDFATSETDVRVAIRSPVAPLPPSLRAGSAEAARAAVTWLRDAAERCLRKDVAAMVTAPVNKESIICSGQPFVGQTELLAELAGTNRAIMMLLGSDDRNRWLRVALATTHLPLKLVAERLDKGKIELAIERAAEACNQLGLTRARVGVCGLNPHAGEGGHLGDEEQTTINPAVESCRKRGVDAVGPLPADTLFHYAFRGDYDAIVAMYHDQGLAPLKMIAFDSGINWTLGLPFIRTSPDHGTAYDIAGKGIANPGSMIAALRLAKQLAAKS